MRKRKATAGFSIIETLVSLGLLSIIAVMTASLMIDQNKQVKTMSQKIGVNDLKNSFLASIQDSASCARNLDSSLDPLLTFDSLSAGNKAISLSKITIGTGPSAQTLAQVGAETSPGSGILVTNITLDQLTNVGSGRWTGIWKIDFNNTFSSFVFKPISLNAQMFDVDTTIPTAAKVTACHSIAAGSATPLTHFTESLNTTAPNSTTPVATLVATNAAINTDVVISPKGLGALAANISDGTSNGGSKRGNQSVDWQMKRLASIKVASGAYSAIGGGENNESSNSHATISGGLGNTASGTSSSIGGGANNSATGASANVGGGNTNTASGDWSSILGGYQNTATANSAVVGGGYQNAASAFGAGVSSGRFNSATASGSFIGGGVSNTSNGIYSTVGGGWQNISSGNYSSVLGGQENIASGDYSFASGRNVLSQSYLQVTIGQANSLTGGNANSWVSTDPLFVIGNGVSPGMPSNAVTVLKNGNVGIGTTSPNYDLDISGDLRITGTPYRSGGDITWQIPSDKNLKNIIGKYQRGLSELAKIEIFRFNYKPGNPIVADTSTEYIGVMAQNVQKVIPEAISTDKASGFLTLNTTPLFWSVVNAVKDLHNNILQLLKATESHNQDIERLKAENIELKKRLAYLESRLSKK